MNEELKPCPFCGGEADIVHEDSNDNSQYWTFFIECNNCEAIIDGRSSEDSVIKAWNKRV